jgi:drug/metabolite transporter (DMT)-like permease
MGLAPPVETIQGKLVTSGSRLMDNRSLLVMVLLILDSVHFVFARLLLPHISPSVSALYVMAVGTLEIGLFGLFRNRLHFDVLGKHLWFFLAIGLLVSISTVTTFEAVAFIDPGTASMLSKTAILFGLVFGILWLHERLTRAQIGGALIAVIGVIVITFQPGDYLRLGSLMIIGAAFIYSLHAAIVKRYGGQIEFLDFFFFRMFCTTGFLFLLSLSRRALVWPGAKAWWLIILTSTVDIAISRTFYYVALRRLKMSIHSIVLALSPVVAVLWSLLLFDTLPSLQQILGGAAVILGVLIATVNQNI